MKKADIEIKKQISQMERLVEQAAKPSFCLLCGKKTSLCNSHIVPRFILKNIARDGKVGYGYSLVDDLDNITDTEKGISNAFTFHLICRDCDKKRFANYEEPKSILAYESLDNSIKNTVLVEMALKTHLAHIASKAKTYCRNSISAPDMLEAVHKAGIKTAFEIDYEEHLQYLQDLSRARKTTSFTFEILYNKLLNYEVDIATQTIIAYIFDLKGNKLFDPYDFKTADLTRYLYLMILPIGGKTRILFYVEKKHKPFVRNIIEQFNELTDEEKLHFLFISLIIYDEQFFINPALLEIIKKDKKLCKLFGKTDASMGNAQNCIGIKNFRKYNNYLLNKNPKDNMNDKTNN